MRKMIGSLSHRGPDGEGVWTGDGVAVAHRRLAIVDLTEAASQPMSYAGRYTITFNGEIYNYIELREELAAEGHQFESASDTEVLLAAHAQWGEACLDRLDGMFAFAIWDAVKRELFCARDRFGEKPFYYCICDGHFLFASEMKALFVGGVKLSIRHEMLYMYLRHDVVQHPDFPQKTFYAPALSLPPAHALTVSRGGGSITPQRYWTLPMGSTTLPFDEQCEEFRKRFSLSVTRRLRSDVPVGTSLSGGLDSTSIVSLVASISTSERHSFSARFSDAALDEGRYIDVAEKATGCIRHDVFPDGGGLADAWKQVFYHQEEPFGTASIFAQWAVMRTAKEHGVVVLLDGQGADETLAGYSHFFTTFLKGVWRRDGTAMYENQRAALEEHYDVPPLRFAEKAQALFPAAWKAASLARHWLLPDATPGFVNPDWHQQFDRAPRPFRNFATLDEALRFFTLDHGLQALLRFADRSSMAFGRETRLPFLSHELVEFIFSTPASSKIWDGSTKRLLRVGLRGLVPEGILGRHDKRGFETPQEVWLNTPKMIALVEAAHHRMTSERLIRGACPGDAKDKWKILCAAGTFEFVSGFAGSDAS